MKFLVAHLFALSTCLVGLLATSPKPKSIKHLVDAAIRGDSIKAADLPQWPDDHYPVLAEVVECALDPLQAVRSADCIRAYNHLSAALYEARPPRRQDPYYGDRIRAAFDDGNWVEVMSRFAGVSDPELALLRHYRGPENWANGSDRHSSESIERAAFVLKNSERFHNFLPFDWNDDWKLTALLLKAMLTYMTPEDVAKLCYEKYETPSNKRLGFNQFYSSVKNSKNADLAVVLGVPLKDYFDQYIKIKH